MLGLSDITTSQLLITLCSLPIAYSIFRALHNVWFHPLAKFPGPKLRGAFHFPRWYDIYSGDETLNIHELHKRYGDIVRLAPDMLSVIKADAWRDIYGHGNTTPMAKCKEFYWRREHDAPDILAANDADHARMRKLLSNAFSEQALRSQEDIITSYITLMVSKLKARALSNSPVDMMQYLTYTTFDITGDLSFDEPFGSLESEKYDAWISNIFDMLRIASVIRVMGAYGVPVNRIIDIIPALARQRDAHDDYTRLKTQKRLEKKTDRKDFMSYIMRYNDQRGMTQTEIEKLGSILVLAGSETTATLLSGAIYYLIKNPTWLVKLRQELHDSMSEETQIMFTTVARLKILNAIIYESFRVYPAVPVALTRVSPKKGATVSGTFIPPDTKIGIPQYAAYRSAHNFADPEQYAPDRFLGNEKYADDQRSIIQPFSLGPRNCIGQNLAWAEMRMILARLVWNFDMELVDPGNAWEKQKTFVLWDKPSLMVKLKVREDAN